MSGWISLHRKIRQNPVFNDVQLLRLWLICLMEASHKEHKILVGKQSVELKIGQFVTGRFELGAKYNEGLRKEDRVSESTVWRWLKTLENLEFLHINSNTKFSLCTVVKWAIYQNIEQQNEQPMNNKRTADEQPMTTNNNGNKGNNENNKSSSRQKRVFTEVDVEFKIASHLLEKIMSINPNVKQPDLQKWSDHVRLMMEQDKRTLDDIRAVVKWMYSVDTFWRTQILSTKSLRDNFDKMNTKRLGVTLQKKSFIPERPINRKDEERDHDEDAKLMEAIREADAKRIAAFKDARTT